MRECLVHDHDERTVGRVGIGDAAPGEDGNAHRLEITGRGDPVVRDGARVAGRAAAAPVDDIAPVEPAGTRETGGFLVRWGRELWRLSIRLVPEYVIIVLALGAARAWLFPTIPAAVGNDVLWIAAVAIAGTAFVIPTAGEVPIVQSLMALSLGAGPAAALLVTLPAVSIPAAVMVSHVFPQRVIWSVAVFVALSGVVAGLVASGLGF